MSINNIDIQSWDCIEDYSQHQVYITEIKEHNIRCELQLDTKLWGQLYDVSENEVIAEETFTDEWEFEAINSWIESNLKTYF